MTRDKYLIHYQGKGRFVELSTRSTTWEQFGQIQREFANIAGRTEDGGPYADMIRLASDQCVFGVFYTWELAGPGGASVELIRLPDTTMEQLQEAAAKIRRDQDVIWMSVTRIDELI